MTGSKSRHDWKTFAVSTFASAVLISASMALPSHSAPEQTASAGIAALGAGPGFADLVELVEPSVVTVEVTKLATSQSSGFNGDPGSEEFFKRFFGPGGQGPQQRQQQRQSQGVGSGFIIDSDGYVVTNNHVISGADSVTVRMNDDRQYDAEVIGYDEKTDLALLKIDADDLIVSTLGDSDTTRVGDWVVAIGNPFGLGGTATAGIVSARGRDIRSGPYDDYMQIDAPINRGNSGGPVFNIAGEVVGVTTAIISPNGGSVGIGFAIPANQVKSIVNELKNNGSVDRGWLGVQLQNIDDDLADGLGLNSAQGALVSDVVAGSPAERAGVGVGDVIIGYENDDVSDARELSRLVGGSDSGDRISMSIWRNDKQIDVEVVLGDAEASIAAVGEEKDFKDLGLTVKPLNDDLRQRLNIEPGVSGALVVDVDPNGKAAEHGLRPGDVLLQVDHEPISTLKDLEESLAKAKQKGRNSVAVLVKRGDLQQFATLPVA